jgi:predicted MFS family arabinose efflux permease
LRQWLPAFSAMACLGFGVGLLGIYGFFVEPLSREFGVGTATINIGPVALLLVPAFAAPVVGKLADRVSIRRLALAGVFCAMLSLGFISVAPSLWLVATGFLGFAFGLTLYGPVVINGLLVKIYPGREARALALAAMGISVASMVLPPVVGELMARFGWRLALLYLASGLLLALWLLVLAGIPSTTGVAPGHGVGELESGIYRHPAFWLIGLSVAMGLNVSLVLGICYPPHFVQSGYTVAEAGVFLAVGGLGGLVGKACIAWLGDAGRAYARWIAAALLLIEGGGICLLLVAQGSGAVFPAVCMIGFAAGGFIPMHPYLNSRYFDAANIGQVNGAQAPLFLPFGLVGAPLAGYAYDTLGNYTLVLQCLVAVLVLAAGMALALPPSGGRGKKFPQV